MMRTPRAKNAAHLDFIRGLPCLVCEDNTSTEAAHIRYTDRAAGKTQAGLSSKPHDYFTVPLCGECHRDQHAYGDERKWWLHEMGVDPIRVALALWAHTGNHEVGEQIVRAAHE